MQLYLYSHGTVQAQEEICLYLPDTLASAQLKEDEAETASHYRGMIPNGLCDRILDTPRRFTPQKEDPLDTRLGGPPRRSGRCEDPCRESSLNPRFAVYSLHRG
jgi:hypothetical protein